MNQEIEKALSSFRIELDGVKAKLAQIPIPFKFMYRPPHEEHHINLVQYLDSIDERLRKLEDAITNGTEVNRT